MFSGKHRFIPGNEIFTANFWNNPSVKDVENFHIQNVFTLTTEMCNAHEAPWRHALRIKFVCQNFRKILFWSSYDFERVWSHNMASFNWLCWLEENFLFRILNFREILKRSFSIPIRSFSETLTFTKIRPRFRPLMTFKKLNYEVRVIKISSNCKILIKVVNKLQNCWW